MSLEKQLADYGRLQEGLFGAIEVDEITNSLTESRREQTPSSQTLSSQRINWRSRYAGPAWAVAAFVAVLAIGALYLAFSSAGDQAADTPPPPTPNLDVETMTDLEVIQAGVHALYSGDADRAVELFELDPTGGTPRAPRVEGDGWIREAAAYQAAIGGRLTLDCTEGGIELDASGLFMCTGSYHDVFTDAIGYANPPETIRVVVDDGVITEFGGFPLFNGAVDGVYAMESFLEGFRDEDGGQDDSESLCEFSFPYTRRGWLTPECVNFALDHLDEWIAWYKASG